MARHFREDFGLETRVARYHNVYGPEGTFEGGREKAPAALSRKIAQAKLSGDHTIEVWGDGEQSRSFMYIDDCVRGTRRSWPATTSSRSTSAASELVTINQMIGILEDIAGITVTKNHDLSAPQGVRGRNSDNTMFRSIYGWEPSISLRDRPRGHLPMDLRPAQLARLTHEGSSCTTSRAIRSRPSCPASSLIAATRSTTSSPSSTSAARGISQMQPGDSRTG